MEFLSIGISGDISIDTSAGIIYTGNTYTSKIPVIFFWYFSIFYTSAARQRATRSTYAIPAGFFQLGTFMFLQVEGMPDSNPEQQICIFS